MREERNHSWMVFLLVLLVIAFFGVSGYRFEFEPTGFRPAIEDSLDQRVLLPVWASLCCKPGAKAFDSYAFWDETSITCPTDVCWITGIAHDHGGKWAIKESWIEMYDSVTEHWINIYQYWKFGENYDAWTREFSGSIKVRARGLDFIFLLTDVGGTVKVSYHRPQLELTVTGATISVDQSIGACTSTGVQGMILDKLDPNQFLTEADVLAGTNPKDATAIDYESFSPYLSSVELYDCKGFVERWQDYPWTYNGYVLQDGRRAICDTVHNELIEVEGYSTITGTLLIPTDVISTVECCAWDDCVGHPSGPWCNEDFKCTDDVSTLPCNTDMECAVGGTKAGVSADCVVKPDGSAVLVGLTCDGPARPELVDTYSGTCVLKEERVACCQSQCESGEVCDYEKGCIEPIAFKDCPENACCRSGIVVDGVAYKQTQDCPLGLDCCPMTTNYGTCEEDCEAPPPTPPGPPTEEEDEKFGLWIIIGLIAAVIIIMMILGKRKPGLGSQTLRRRRFR